MDHESFLWLNLIPGVKEHGLSHLATALLVLGLVALLGVVGKAALQKDPDVPADRFGVRAFWELVVEFLVNTTRTVIPHHPERYVPLLGAVFIYIFFCNAIGLVPGFEAPTGNVNTNAAVAIVVWLAYHFYGIRENGWGYIRQFTGPFTGFMLVFAVIMIPIELIGHAARPMTLTLRLYANMMADHMTVSIFTDLTKVIVPVIFLALGLMVSLIQAFVFYILSTVYIGLAVSHDH